MKFVPSYSVFVNETAFKPRAVGFGTAAAAVKFAESCLRSFVIRRSNFANGREYYTGMVVYTKR